MRATPIRYWVTTTLLALALASGGLAQLGRVPANVEGIVRLGYPPYVMTILGLCKLLGVAVLLAPRLPRLKEWAYAGIVFELVGASASSLAAGVGLFHVMAPLALAALALGSWALRPAARTLGALSATRVP